MKANFNTSNLNNKNEAKKAKIIENIVSEKEKKSDDDHNRKR